MDWKQAAAQLRTDPDTMQLHGRVTGRSGIDGADAAAKRLAAPKSHGTGRGRPARRDGGALKTVLSSGEGRALLQRLSQQLK